jgi:hypothetical protein
VLVPYPAATDNHQFHNARAFEATGAARLLDQRTATPETLAQLLLDLVEKPAVYEQMRNALAQWHAPHAAEQIAEVILLPAGAGVGKGYPTDSEPAALPGSQTSDIGSNPNPSRPSPPERIQVRYAAGYPTALPERRVA